jgi:glutamyl-tRNA reductase
MERAEEAAKQYNALAQPLQNKRRILKVSDVVISATSAPHSIIHREDIADDGRELLLFDLANPIDIDRDIRELAGKRVYDLEQIEHRAKQNLRARRQAVADCEAIIEEEIAELKRWETFRREYRKEVTA